MWFFFFSIVWFRLKTGFWHLIRFTLYESVWNKPIRTMYMHSVLALAWTQPIRGSIRKFLDTLCWRDLCVDEWLQRIDEVAQSWYTLRQLFQPLIPQSSNNIADFLNFKLLEKAAADKSYPDCPTTTTQQQHDSNTTTTQHRHDSEKKKQHKSNNTTATLNSHNTTAREHNSQQHNTKATQQQQNYSNTTATQQQKQQHKHQHNTVATQQRQNS